jgi:hypothetical protein
MDASPGKTTLALAITSTLLSSQTTPTHRDVRLTAFVSGATPPHYRSSLALSSTKFLWYLALRSTASQGRRLRRRVRGSYRPADGCLSTHRCARLLQALFTLALRSGERKSGIAGPRPSESPTRWTGSRPPVRPAVRPAAPRGSEELTVPIIDESNRRTLFPSPGKDRHADTSRVRRRPAA